MIKIKATYDSDADSSFDIEIPGEINPQRERSQKITTTLSGGAACTFWAKNNEGSSQTIEITISELKYISLMAIVNHSTEFEWLVFCDGRRYKCAIDTGIAVTVSQRGITYKRVPITFTVIKDYN